MLYALHDSDPILKRKGAFPILKEEAPKYNQLNYGIFWTPNVFKGQRKASNLEKIRYWIADIDTGSKEEQLDRINKLPILPNNIVETKKGYHCYWKANDATLENYRDIAIGLIERLNADKACKDVCRLLRYPGFYHCKDPNNRFLVKEVASNEYVATESQMLCAYQIRKKIYKPITKYEGSNQDMILEENWDRYFRFNQAMVEGRNNYFTRVIFWLRDKKFPKDVIESVCEDMNNKLPKSLDKWELETIIKSKV